MARVLMEVVAPNEAAHKERWRKEEGGKTTLFDRYTKQYHPMMLRLMTLCGGETAAPSKIVEAVATVEQELSGKAASLAKYRTEAKKMYKGDPCAVQKLENRFLDPAFHTAAARELRSDGPRPGKRQRSGAEQPGGGGVIVGGASGALDAPGTSPVGLCDDTARHQSAHVRVPPRVDAAPRISFGIRDAPPHTRRIVGLDPGTLFGAAIIDVHHTGGVAAAQAGLVHMLPQSQSDATSCVRLEHLRQALVALLAEAAPAHVCVEGYYAHQAKAHGVEVSYEIRGAVKMAIANQLRGGGESTAAIGVTWCAPNAWQKVIVGFSGVALPSQTDERKAATCAALTAGGLALPEQLPLPDGRTTKAKPSVQNAWDALGIAIYAAQQQASATIWPLGRSDKLSVQALSAGVRSEAKRPRG
jgi:Holliday junction resolvasome RuvABC endonuclease subunit